MTRNTFSRFAFTALALASAHVLGASSALAQTPSPTFSRIIVFGDSLSDVGNLRDRMEDKGLNYPGGEYNYSDGRFTNSTDTDPSSDRYVGVWHEQLARTFLTLPRASHSEDGGDSFAFGGATTRNGERDYSIIGVFGNDITVSIDNIGQQVDDYITKRTVDPAALHVVWGGGNDLFDDHSAANVDATSGRVAMLVSRLANAGARHILVPNVPPLGGVPRYGDDREAQDAKHEASADYRARLEADLETTFATLRSQGIEGLTIYRMDVWSLFIRFAADPSRYGFRDILNPARGKDVDPDTYAFWDDIHPTTAAHFEIAQEANRVLGNAIQRAGRALNVSTRVTVSGGENVAIGGFIISGSQPKRVIVRGIGPSLAQLKVAGPLSDPTIELFNSSNTSLRANDDWRQSQQAEIIATGLAPADERESAIVETLAPGDYTVVLSGKNAASGVGLVEIYDLDSDEVDSNLANLSTRGAVGTGDNVMIGGVIIGEGGETIVVVRAIGPSLAGANIGNPLLDPMLELRDSNGVALAMNDDWKEGQPAAAKATLLAPTDERESTITTTLLPGSYTAIVRGKNNSTGVALVEVYRIRDIATR